MRNSGRIVFLLGLAAGGTYAVLHWHELNLQVTRLIVTSQMDKVAGYYTACIQPDSLTMHGSVGQCLKAKTAMLYDLAEVETVNNGLGNDYRLRYPDADGIGVCKVRNGLLDCQFQPREALTVAEQKALFPGLPAPGR